MNIIFKDEDLFLALKEIAIERIVVGSHMYGFNDNESDIDYLHILPINNNICNNVFRSHHQLQYKFKNADHVFVFIDTFLKNIFNGDSSINFEVLQNIDEHSNLCWLIPFKKKLFTYTIIKSYLGFAKRDIKYFSKENNLRAKRRKLKHIYRSYLSAKLIYNMEFSIDKIKGDSYFHEIDKIDNDIDFNLELKKQEVQVSTLRELANKTLNDRKLNYFMNETDQKELNNEYIKYINCSMPKIEYNNIFSNKIMTLYYNVNENGLNY